MKLTSFTAASRKLLVIFGALAAQVSAPCQDVKRAASTHPGYMIIPITSGATNHKWPSVNNSGAIVWSQQMPGSCASSQCWQVFESSASGIQQITSDAHNHSYPAIDDNGDIVYLKDGSGGGAGLEVAELSSGVENVIEFSSGNPPGCTEPPAGPATCASWRSAGMHFGVAKTSGQIISYHDFCSPSCSRTFDVSNFGQLTGVPSAAGYPDVNGNGDVVYWDGSGNVMKTNLSGAPPVLIAPGTEARINDFGDVVLVNGPQVGVYPAGPTYQLAATFSGSWSDRNNSCIVVYEGVDSSGHHQVFQAQTCGSTAASRISAAAATQCANCANPPSLNIGWPKNQPVLISLAQGWTKDEQSAILQAFTNWTDANTTGGDGSGVTFSLTGTSTLVHQVLNQICPPPSPTCQNQTPAVSGTCTCYTPATTTTLASATTYLNPKYDIVDQLTARMAHEIGHGMSLNDCGSCPLGESVMTGVQLVCPFPPPNNNGCTVKSSLTPSDCDKQAVMNFYSTMP